MTLPRSIGIVSISYLQALEQQLVDEWDQLVAKLVDELDQ